MGNPLEELAIAQRAHEQDQPPFGDIRDTLVDLPHGDPYGGMSYVRSDLFTVRHALIRQLEPGPTSVFEFGALVGYFLVTALDAASSIERVGWVDDESHTPGSNAMCLRNVMSVRSWNSSRLDWWPSRDNVLDGLMQRHDSPLRATYDLVSVDSDHSYEGALADLRAAHALSPRWIFIDDWTAGTHGDDIHAAVETFLADVTDWRDDEDDWCEYDLAEYVTVNGLAVLTRKEHA